MKLRYLSMTAFGPYRQTAEINFEDFYEDGIFLIRGATGSGKTSILDALTFVFYDESSGGDRGSWKNFRCQHAAPDLPTRVFCDVDLQSGSYRFEAVINVTNKRDGSLELKGPEHMIYRLEEGQPSDGTDIGLIPLVPRLTRKQAVDKATELIGLSREQFCQVVLLPQGQFGRFLTAESKDKEAILNSIFKTERYSLSAARLAEQANLQKKQLKTVDDRLQVILGQAGVSSTEALEEKVRLASQNIETLNRALQEAEQKAAKAQAAYAAGEHLARAYAEKKRLQEEQAKLEESKFQAARDEEKLKLAQKAAAVSPFIQQCEAMAGRLANSRLSLAEDEAKAAQAKRVLADLKTREADYAAVQSVADQLRDSLPMLDGAIKSQVEAKRLEQDKQELTAQLKQLEKKRASLLTSIQALDRELETSGQDLAAGVKIETLRSELRIKTGLVESMRSMAGELQVTCAVREEKKQGIKDLAFKLKQAKQRQEQLDEAYKKREAKAESKWLFYFKEQAQVAGTCPVCGGLCRSDIKNKQAYSAAADLAEDKADQADRDGLELLLKGEPVVGRGTDLDDRLAGGLQAVQAEIQELKLQEQRSKSDLEHLDTEINRLTLELKRAGRQILGETCLRVDAATGSTEPLGGAGEGSSQVGETEACLLDWVILEQELAASLATDQAQIEAQAAALEAARETRQKQKTKRQKLDESRQTCEQQLQACEKAEVLIAGRLAELDQQKVDKLIQAGLHRLSDPSWKKDFLTRTAQFYKQIDPGLLAGNLAEEGDLLLKTLQKLSRAVVADLQAYQEGLAEAEREILSAEAGVKAVQAVLREQEEALKKLVSLKSDQIFKSGETEETLKEAYLPEEEVERLDASLAERKERVKQLKLRLVVLAETIDGQAPPDLDELLTAKERETEYLKNLQVEGGRAAGELDNLSSLLDQAVVAGKEFEQQRVEAEELAEFADLVAGKRGLSLQRYVLQQMLFRVIQEANQLLEHVHRGRYQLNLTDEKQGREQKTGLNFNVYDCFTEEERGVATLSGGEKFLVSLALSLALSAVVQLSSGGIRIQSMFVDEGFGALDEESLDEAMEMLLRSRTADRLVGIISHVKDIQALVPQVLEVVKTDKGSYLSIRN